MVRYFRWMAITALFIYLSGASPEFALAKISLNHKQLLPINISHRGASGHAPEHTLQAYELGNVMNGDYIEIDLQMTKDGELIALHDETIDRTTEEKGLVKNLTLREIKKLDAGSWFNVAFPEKMSTEYSGLKIPTLREVLDRFGPDSKFFIETKSPEVYPGMEEKLINILNEYNLIGVHQTFDNVIVQSFSVESLRKVHEIDDSIPLVQLLSYYAPAVITDTEVSKIKEYAVGVGLHYTAVSPGYIKKINDSGLMVFPYTVNEKEDMNMLLDWGVTGMFTNYPDRLNEVIHSRTLENLK
ncbi:glycerophosphodiester phosphodiesterase [Mesobacillus subterraneus]|uniref:glycerophosphodiester phosphodiesterase n=1 Tax=Mesobacillus subterraneus TaxID=285983 RepID=UPI001CFE7EDD|nr:glycerophosphodiester phosphodiesterase [Mesobacillus subterraneus]WLR57034.1 glycerophosphodiester phosphodiesterase [Mesobacillus subterraneus]